MALDALRVRRSDFQIAAAQKNGDIPVRMVVQRAVFVVVQDFVEIDAEVTVARDQVPALHVRVGFRADDVVRIAAQQIA
jgi:hypothetical protein